MRQRARQRCGAEGSLGKALGLFEEARVVGVRRFRCFVGLLYAVDPFVPLRLGNCGNKGLVITRIFGGTILGSAVGTKRVGFYLGLNGIQDVAVIVLGSVTVLGSSEMCMAVSTFVLVITRVLIRPAANGRTVALLRLAVEASDTAVSDAFCNAVGVFLGAMGMSTSVEMIVNDLFPADYMMVRAGRAPWPEP